MWLVTRVGRRRGQPRALVLKAFGLGRLHTALRRYPASYKFECHGRTQRGGVVVDAGVLVGSAAEWGDAREAPGF
jgi:hypothetical protein